jgi:hypothetical protein
MVEKLAVMEQEKTNTGPETLRQGISIDPFLFFEGQKQTVKGAAGYSRMGFYLSEAVRIAGGAQQFHNGGNFPDGVAFGGYP